VGHRVVDCLRERRDHEDGEHCQRQAEEDDEETDPVERPDPDVPTAGRTLGPAGRGSRARAAHCGTGIFLTAGSLRTLSVMSCRPLVSPLTSISPDRNEFHTVSWASFMPYRPNTG